MQKVAKYSFLFVQIIFVWYLFCKLCHCTDSIIVLITDKSIQDRQCDLVDIESNSF
jgi:hypothetical protein